jgi:hypothetical protein
MGIFIFYSLTFVLYCYEVDNSLEGMKVRVYLMYVHSRDKNHLYKNRKRKKKGKPFDTSCDEGYNHIHATIL